MKTLPALSWFAALGLSLAVAGCNLIPPPDPDPTRYYVLTSPAPEPAVTRVAQGSVRIGLRAVELAPYLRKGVLVVRHGENELVFDDFARWGEPLEAGIGRALRAQLQADARVGRVFASPFPLDEGRDYDVLVTVSHCEGVRTAHGAAVRFSAEVQIVRPADGGESVVVARRVFTAPEVSWDGRNHAALVRSLSDAVSALSREVVAAMPAASSR